MSQRRAVQRGPNLWISGADQERTGPAAVPADPAHDQTIRRLYKGRTAVERVNARLKLYWGADDGNVVGARRFHAMVGVVMLVHLALGTALAGKGRGTIKTLGGTRLSPIAERSTSKSSTSDPPCANDERP